MKDGVFDITHVFGHDYNTPRSDLREAEEMFHHLKNRGFRTPVASFADLKSDSGPFTLDFKAGNKAVKMEVRLFHADMFLSQTPKIQHDLTVKELVTRDVATPAPTTASTSTLRRPPA